MAPLTFGIELECHVATLAYGEEDPEPRDPRQVYDLTMQIIGSRVHELRGKTVEFRQHAGTVDADAVVNWIKFVTKLVEVAVRDMENPRGMLWKEVDREEKQAPARGKSATTTDTEEYVRGVDSVGQL
ncbi:hypothetical protein M7I_7880 [Glarea lozoyensis 74030]|uniref:Uncharacterized protein n=1 Tax=Glarea lozoyensis (strain ATCC 74030 / MF5533) TaxID=1104152 RepID=H0EYH8_GLAL7|nr:hypothetical protein M7I_7880 [Glarea lozoyensis 74030]